MMYEYKAKILSVYDGDGAFDARIDLGMKITIERPIRLGGVDTPEIRGEQHNAGVAVRDFVRSLILDREVIVCTHKDASGKYGRLLADILVEHKGVSVNLAQLLIVFGLAKPYNGGHKSQWDKEELDYIVNNIDNIRREVLGE